jgi:hypothetical protein
MPLGKLLVVIGLAIAAAGALVWWGVPFGRLPGDLVIRRGAFTFQVPITSCIIVSVMITAVLAWLKR